MFWSGLKLIIRLEVSSMVKCLFQEKEFNQPTWWRMTFCENNSSFEAKKKVKIWNVENFDFLGESFPNEIKRKSHWRGKISFQFNSLIYLFINEIELDRIRNLFDRKRCFSNEFNPIISLVFRLFSCVQIRWKANRNRWKVGQLQIRLCLTSTRAQQYRRKIFSYHNEKIWLKKVNELFKRLICQSQFSNDFLANCCGHIKVNLSKLARLTVFDVFSIFSLDTPISRWRKLMN